MINCYGKVKTCKIIKKVEVLYFMGHLYRFLIVADKIPNIVDIREQSNCWHHKVV